MTSRVTINSAGVPRRVALKNPPHFRTGQDAAPAIDRVAAAAAQAVRSASAAARDRRGIRNK